MQIQWLRKTSWLLQGGRATLWWNDSIPPFNPQNYPLRWESSAHSQMSMEEGGCQLKSIWILEPLTFPGRTGTTNAKISSTTSFSAALLESCAYVLFVCVSVCVLRGKWNLTLEALLTPHFWVSERSEETNPGLNTELRATFAWPLVFITKKVCISTTCKCFQLLAN